LIHLIILIPIAAEEVLVTVGYIAAMPANSDRSNHAPQALFVSLTIGKYFLGVLDYHRVFVLAIEAMVVFKRNAVKARAEDVLGKIRAVDPMLAAGTIHEKPNELRIGATDGKVDRPIVLGAGSLLKVLE
jgi:hypothetical protein